MCIIVGDLHLKEKQLYKQAQKKFLNYLQENFNDETLILLGDVFDSSSPTWEVYSSFKQFLLNRDKPTYILQGNHDFSRRKGSVLKGIHLMENVHVYFKEKFVNIEGHDCLILPFQYDMEHYKDIVFNEDFTFCHFTNVESQFDDEGIEIKGIAPSVTQYFGHTHTYQKFGNKIILGVPVITRNGEKNNFLIKINSDKSIEEIIIPEFINILDIKYGEDISNFDFIYNVLDAPSYQSVYDMYPQENIRHQGITLKSFDESGEEESFVFDDQSFQKHFIDYAEEFKINRNIKKKVLELLDKALI